MDRQRSIGFIIASSVLLYTIVFFGLRADSGLEWNTLGDTLAGFFAPLGFAALTITLWAQIEALKIQRQEFQETTEQTKKQIESLKLQETDREQKARLDRTLLFVREFSSKEMSEIRNKAAVFIENNRDLVLHDELGRKEAQTIPVWIIARFFQSLWIHLSTERADKDTAARLLGSLFVWWWENYLSHGLKENWEITDHLKACNKWIVDDYTRSGEYDRWKDQAWIDRRKAEKRQEDRRRNSAATRKRRARKKNTPGAPATDTTKKEAP